MKDHTSNTSMQERANACILVMYSLLSTPLFGNDLMNDFLLGCVLFCYTSPLLPLPSFSIDLFHGTMDAPFLCGQAQPSCPVYFFLSIGIASRQERVVKEEDKDGAKRETTTERVKGCALDEPARHSPVGAEVNGRGNQAIPYTKIEAS